MPAELTPEQRAELARQLLALGEAAKGLTPQQRFEVAKEIAATLAPTWRHLIRRWRPQPRRDFENGKVRIKDGRDVLFDPKMPLNVLAAELIHVTDHWFYGHKQRRGDRDVQSWQLAACMETIKRWDETIHRAGLEWAPGSDPRQEHGDLPRGEAEDLYRQIEAEKEQAGESGGQGEGDPHDMGDEGPEGDGMGDGEGDGEGQGQGKPGKGKPGKGKPGQGQPGDGDGQPGEGQPGKGQPGDGKPTKGSPGQGDGTCSLEEDDFDDLDGLEDGEGEGEGEGDGDGDGDGQGKGDGKGKPGKGTEPGQSPGDRLLEIRKQRIWANLTFLIRKKLMRGSGTLDYSKSKRSKRSPADLILSSQYQRPEQIVVIVDTSGSVNDEMRSAIAELCMKLQKATPGVRIKLACGDTKLQNHGTLSAVINNLKGGGGTDMEAVIEQGWKALHGGTRLLVITDGESSKWPAKFPQNTLLLIVNNKPLSENRYIIDRIKPLCHAITLTELLTGAKPPGERQVA